MILFVKGRQLVIGITVSKQCCSSIFGNVNVISTVSIVSEISKFANGLFYAINFTQLKCNVSCETEALD